MRGEEDAKRALFEVTIGIDETLYQSNVKIRCKEAFASIIYDITQIAGGCMYTSELYNGTWKKDDHEDEKNQCFVLKVGVYFHERETFYDKCSTVLQLNILKYDIPVEYIQVYEVMANAKHIQISRNPIK